MAQEVRSFPVIVPAGTAVLAPQVTALSMPSRIVERIEVEVPPGPRGEVGFALGSSGVQMLPFTPGTWIVTDNRVVEFIIEDFWDSGSWQLRAYNTGQFDHTLTVTFHLQVPQLKGVAAVAPIPVEQLGAAPQAALPAPPQVPAPAQILPPPLPLPALPALPALPPA